MNDYPLIFLAATIGVLACSGQTDSPAPRQWFSLPRPTLRPLTPAFDAPESGWSPNLHSARFSLHALHPAGNSRLLAEARIAVAPDREVDTGKSAPTRLPAAMSLNSSLSETDLRMCRMLAENGHLKRRREEPDNLFARFANRIFEPTPIRIGKTTVACSVITAMKKRNPLCLLNPMVLNISW